MTGKYLARLIIYASLLTMATAVLVAPSEQLRVNSRTFQDKRRIGTVATTEDNPPERR